MNMQRRHFQLIADMLKEGKEIGVYRSQKAYGQYCVRWADELARTNGAFDRYRFLQACGVV